MRRPRSSHTWQDRVGQEVERAWSCIASSIQVRSAIAMRQRGNDG